MQDLCPLEGVSCITMLQVHVGFMGRPTFVWGPLHGRCELGVDSDPTGACPFFLWIQEASAA